MRILDKYLVREFTTPVFYCVTAFSSMFVIWDLFDRLSGFVEAKTPPAMMLRYYGSYLVQVMEYLLPASLLLATLFTLWRFTRHNELVAIRASGISVMRIMLPFVCVGLLFSGIMAVLKEAVVPDASQWVADFMKNKYVMPKSIFRENVVYYNPVASRVWLIDRFDRRNPNTLYGVRITWERPDRTRDRDLIAAKAEWVDGEWWVFNAEMQEYGGSGGPAGPRRPFPGSSLGRPLRGLSEKPTDFVNEIKNPVFFSTGDIRRFLRSHPSLSRRERRRWVADIHGKAAAPWACAIVILFGIPVGVRGTRHNALTGVLFALLLFVAFYALSQLGLLMGRTGAVWPWLGAWLANVVFLCIGVTMLVRLR
ncbi:MAG: YjgP/YjgQ family permease [Lentisphaerae bacterium]|nr:YjgP/YjgQ family permease [Lentisphaerota bacterium]